MTYTEWRDELKNNLLSVSESERKRVLEYYAEAYADRREAGYSERDIIAQFGAPYDAAQRILSEDVGGGYEAPIHRIKEEPKPAPKPAPQPAPAPAQVSGATPAPAPAEAVKKKRSKLWWLFLPVAFLLGAGLVFFLIVFALNDWGTAYNFEMAQYTTEDEVEAIRIVNAVGSVKTEFYDGDKIIVDYPVSETHTMSVEERDGQLTVDGLRQRHWYNFFIGLSNFPETTVKIPKDAVLKLDVTVKAGKVELAAGEYASTRVEVHAGSLEMLGVVCTDFRCEVSAGSVSVKSLVCSSFDCGLSAGSITVNSLESRSFDCNISAGSFIAERVNCPLIQVDVSAGSAHLGVAGKREEYYILVDRSAGSCNVSSQIGIDPNKKIDIDISAGSVYVSFV